MNRPEIGRKLHAGRINFTESSFSHHEAEKKSREVCTTSNSESADFLENKWNHLYNRNPRYEFFLRVLVPKVYEKCLLIEGRARLWCGRCTLSAWPCYQFYSYSGWIFVILVLFRYPIHHGQGLSTVWAEAVSFLVSCGSVFTSFSMTKRSGKFSDGLSWLTSN